jgi:hypothetical protein
MLHNIVKLVFEKNSSPLEDKLMPIIDKYLDFSVEFYSISPFDNSCEISFDENEINIILEISDQKDNYGSCICTFTDKLKQVDIYFMYESGNEYNETIYKV